MCDHRPDFKPLGRFTYVALKVFGQITYPSLHMFGQKVLAIKWFVALFTSKILVFFLTMWFDHVCFQNAFWVSLEITIGFFRDVLPLSLTNISANNTLVSHSLSMPWCSILTCLWFYTEIDVYIPIKKYVWTLFNTTNHFGIQQSMWHHQGHCKAKRFKNKVPKVPFNAK